MNYYSVKEIANILNVNEETVRRWIREEKLEAERGIGRQGSKISNESIKKFLISNKGLITNTAISSLGLSVGSIPILGASILGASTIFQIMNSKSKNKDAKRIELMEQEMELEKYVAQLKNEIDIKKNALELVESQISKIREMIEMNK